MKKTLSYLVLALLTLSACVGKATTSEQTSAQNEYVTDNEQSDGIQRMHMYNYSDTILVEGKTYIYTIHREPSDSLPIVTDDEGTRYADNIYTLSLNRGDEYTMYTFTKRNFMSYLSPLFQRKGILDGMMCDKTLQGLRFAVSVSLPQSDMFEPLLLTIDPRGGMTIVRDERGEAQLEDDNDGV